MSRKSLLGQLSACMGKIALKSDASHPHTSPVKHKSNTLQEQYVFKANHIPTKTQRRATSHRPARIKGHFTSEPPLPELPPTAPIRAPRIDTATATHSQQTQDPNGKPPFQLHRGAPFQTSHSGLQRSRKARSFLMSQFADR